MPKDHKSNLPVRPIISYRNAPSYGLSKYFAHLLKPFLANFGFGAKNSYEVVNKLKNINIASNERMASLDVTQLFTNISTSMAIDVVNKKISENPSIASLPKNLFMEGLSICLNSTYLTFRKHFYQQIYGVAMGSPCAMVIADLVMAHIEETNIKPILYKFSFYSRYVDDTLISGTEDNINSLYTTLNQTNQRIKFTREDECHQKINFLDISIERKTNTLTLGVSHKSVSANNMIRADSNHAITQKEGTIKGFALRALRFCNEAEPLSQELDWIRNIFKNAGFCGKRIDSIIQDATKQHNDDKSMDADKVKKTRIPITFTSNNDYRCYKKLLKDSNIELAYKPVLSMMNLFPSVKDRQTRGGAIYDIECEKCSQHYIGETERQLAKREYEHSYAIRSHNIKSSAIADHAWSEGHFDYKKATIIQHESNYTLRKIKEAYQIRKKAASINRIEERGKLDPILYDLNSW